MKFSSALLRCLSLTLGTAALLLQPGYAAPVSAQEGDNPEPPAQPVKLIFIHHSTGENWLRDGYGDLGRTLAANNYFVSDTNYGWGPGAIGDTTDIVDWPKWFGPQRQDVVLKALFNESGQNSEYSRSLQDPGGENEVILFKSCFPNSELSGSPNDPPTPLSYELSVGSAKAIYNQLLDYFITRPDKMFVVITAPPVSDLANSDNARAFNTWLMTAWLADYQGSNVFVFDFYNILTAPGNHHRYKNNAIEYIANTGGNTSYYPTGNGDDHPNEAGSRKATEELVPLLNIFYHRWKASAPSLIPAPPVPEGQSAVPPDKPQGGRVDIDTFDGEGESPETFSDETGSTIACTPDDSQAYGGVKSLKVSYRVEPGGYAGCGRFYGAAQDWSRAAGLSLWLKMDQPAALPLLTIHCGSAEISAPYQISLKPATANAEGWAPVFIPWADLVRASWADNAGPAEFDPASVMGYDFGFSADTTRLEGLFWMDEITLSGVEDGLQQPTPAPAETALQTEQAPQGSEQTDQGNQEQMGAKGLLSKLPCCSSAAFPLALLALFLWLKRM
jgi:hypothetical protein